MSEPADADRREFWQSRLAEYLEHLRVLDRATGTIQDNKTVLTRWVDHALSHDASPDTFDADVIEAFLDALDLALNSRRGYTSHIRGWCQWSQNLSVRVWVVRAGRDGEAEQHNLDNSVTTIGWGELGEDVEQFTDREEFGSHLEERHNAPRVARDQIWRFAKEIEIGDLVVMPQKRTELGRQRLIAIGRVVGSYQYDPLQSEDERKRRKVEWLHTDLAIEEIWDDLWSVLSLPPTLYSPEEHDAQFRLKYLAEHGYDPGSRFDIDPQYWAKRLKEYLSHLGERDHAADTINNKRSVLGRWIDHALAHGQSPGVIDQTLLGAFLDAQDLGDGARGDYTSHINSWCRYLGTTPYESEDSDTTSLQERLESAAKTLLCDLGHLQEIVDLLEDKGQVILYGPPGTGKTYLAQELAEALAPEEEARSLVQFHPAYSYEDFFEGYRPVVDKDKQMTYELTWGPLATLVDHAVENPEQQHVMVIDEINRANLPRVLGELLFLLEYRDKSMDVMYRPDGSFRLPKNLWFIGTMNTADRSIALIDAAMRRRFHFVPFFPEREPTKSLLRKWTDEHAPEQEWVVGLVSAVNAELEKELGGDHLQLGPSHFMKTALSLGGFERVWKYNIEPFIEDQLFGKPDRIERFRMEAVLRRHGPAESDLERDFAPPETDRGKGGRQNNDAMATGQEIHDGFKSGNSPYTWMGRQSGLNGQPLREDLTSGGWRTWSYEVRFDPLHQRNWFPIEAFVELVDQSADRES